MKHVLVTGGTGYIGSHTVIQLQQAGFSVTIVDNLCNSKALVVDRIEAISGIRPEFVEADIRDRAALEALFQVRSFYAVVHFAGLKAVGESTEKPLEYFDNNVNGTIQLCEVMNQFGCRRIIFSSSATVYGDPKEVPITEEFATGNVTNPYGRSKLMVEQVLEDLHRSDAQWQVVVLRYFNPIGAHVSGTIGEDPNDIPNNLLPFVTQVACGKREKLSVFGSDYPTRDGTGVRDYIHVEDLAAAHVAAVEKAQDLSAFNVFNLGTGNGHSVLEVVTAFEKVNQVKVAYEPAPRREGDIAECWADASLAKQVLGWSAQRDLATMLRDAWRWQSNNPDGYSNS